MKALLVAAMILAVTIPAMAGAPVGAKADAKAGAEAAINKVWQEFSDSWARGDATGRAKLWAENGTLITPFGQEAKGREAIQKVFEQESAGFAKGSTNTLSNFSYRFLTPNLAEVDATGEIMGAKGADGAPMPPMKVHVFAVMTKMNGKWEMQDARPYMIMPQPGGQATGSK